MTRTHIPIPKPGLSNRLKEFVKLKRTSGLPKVSKKRRAANSEYSERRKRYLEEHPYCQIFIKLRDLNEADVIKNNGTTMGRDMVHGVKVHYVPRATTIHHTKKPRCKYLNDESTWLSASMEWHDWVENHKADARRLGLLFNV